MITLKPYLMALVVGCASGVVVANASKRLRGAHLSTPEEQQMPLFSKTDPSLLELSSMGHYGLYHAYLALWTTQGLSDVFAGVGDQAQWRSALALSARHRPRFETFYLATCILSNTANWSEDACLTAASLGQEVLPDSWRLPLAQAYVYQMKKKDMDKAAAFYALAASKPGVLPIIAGAATYNAGDLTIEQQAERARALMKEAVGGTDLQDLFDKNEDEGRKENQ